MTERKSTAGNLDAWRIAGLAMGVGTAWVFFEWLFFATKPSFMSLYSWWEKLSVLSSTALIVTVGLLLVTLPFAALGGLLMRLGVRQKAVSALIFLPVILLLAMAILVVIDNFTLTLFGWGIRNASGANIYLYRVLTIALVVMAAWLLHGFWSGRYSSLTRKSLSWLAGLLVLSSLPFLLFAMTLSREEALVAPAAGPGLPNILILNGDGISADHMSVYGYERPTTPFLDRVSDEFLVAENHFTNASDTGGSVISLLSGKLPTTTRVIYPPDALRGKDSYQHLPGMLKKLGYYNADISMRHYADPYDLNMRDGFAEANFRQLKDTGGTLVAAIRKYPALNPASLLLDRISERISERYRHIWKDKKMMDPLAEVNQPDLRWIQDDARLAEIHRLVSDAPRPFFLHVLTMGTHGEWFRPTKRVYSTEDDYEIPWSVDGYDDAIMDFDRFVEEIYGLLRDQGLLESTVLLVSSDHGFVHDALARVPMLMRLPGRSRTGFLGGNTQRLDIVPTLLDVLGIKPLPWMEGQSMLKADPSVTGRRPVFASGSRGNKSAVGNFWSVRNPEPPWYSLGRLSLIHCEQAFLLWLESMRLDVQNVSGSTAACADRLSPDQAREILLGHLKDKGYQTP